MMNILFIKCYRIIKSREEMSIFIIGDIDNIFLPFCDVIDDLIKIKQLNKYYNKLTNNNILFKSWVELYLNNKYGEQYRINIRNNLFVTACGIDSLLRKYLIKKFPDINRHPYCVDALMVSCTKGYLHVVQWLTDLNDKKWKNVMFMGFYSIGRFAFVSSCKNGHLRVAQWLMGLSKKSNLSIDVLHVDDDYSFRLSCEHGHLHVAKWLMDLSQKSNSLIDIHQDHDCAFKRSCKNGHLHVAQWLTTLSNKYVILNSSSNGKIDYQIF